MWVIFWGSGGRFFGFRGSPGSGVGVPQNRGSGGPKIGGPGGPPGVVRKSVFFGSEQLFGFSGSRGGILRKTPVFGQKVGVIPKSPDFWTPTLIGVRIDFFRVFRKTPVLGVVTPDLAKKWCGTPEI